MLIIEIAAGILLALFLRTYWRPVLVWLGVAALILLSFGLIAVGLSVK